MLSRADVKYEIYERLNKSPATRGFYTDKKCESAIQESIDFVSTELFLADEGYLHKIDYLDTESNQITIPVPSYMAMVIEVRYLLGNTYIPLVYDQQFQTPQWSDNSGVVQFPSRYRIVDNRFYFSPAFGQGGEKYLMVEYFAYPTVLRNDSQKLDPQFDRCMAWFIIYNSMTIMSSSMQQFAQTWKPIQDSWYNKMLMIVNTRNVGPTNIQDFEGY